MGNGLLFWVPVEHGNNLCVLPSHRVVIGFSQRKATSVDLYNWRFGRNWTECTDKEPLRELERKEKEIGSKKQKCVLSSAEVLGGVEMKRWTGKEDEIHELVGLLEFALSPAWQVCLNDLFWQRIRRSSYTGRVRIPNNGQFLTTSYTSLYFILDTYSYSKALSPGVNNFCCHKTRVSCQVFIG